jgi:hypothetical protein
MSTETKHAGGRPPALEPTPETLKIVFGLGSIQATLKECAAVLGVGEATFLRFKERHPIVAMELERGQSEGLASLRRAQFKKAIDGNPTMLIWLGKQYLGQKDQIEHSVGNPSGKPIRYTLTDAELLAIATGLDGAGPYRPEDGGDGTAETETGQRVIN